MTLYTFVDLRKPFLCWTVSDCDLLSANSINYTINMNC